MCRWIAYSGRPIFLDDALFTPENSLIHQSLHASRSVAATNGDGFGVGWYSERPTPGLYRDIRPAWNDDNLRNMSEQIRSRLFLAHVRHSTGTAISRMNCHPFRHGKWLFMHNGQIGGYERIRRELDMRIQPEFYPERAGTTDSEAIFLLLLGHGLKTDAAVAFRRTVAEIESVMKAAGIEAPLRMTAAASDGEHIYAVRYASDGQSPSLFYGHRAFADATPDGSEVVVLSEPLDSEVKHWVEVPDARILVAGRGTVAATHFAPAP